MPSLSLHCCRGYFVIEHQRSTLQAGAHNSGAGCWPSCSLCCPSLLTLPVIPIIRFVPSPSFSLPPAIPLLLSVVKISFVSKKIGNEEKKKNLPVTQETHQCLLGIFAFVLPSQCPVSWLSHCSGWLVALPFLPLL